MIKKLVLVFIALFAIQSYAQEGTRSPYSFYGIGSLKFKGTVENRSMGGLSIYKDSTHINLRNPATYGGNNIASFNNESRPVKFSVGGGYSKSNLESSSSSDGNSVSTFDYLALSVPIGKLGFGFGLLPYTSVGYKLETRNSEGNLDNRYRGEGGVNKAFFSLGYQLSKSLSIGVDANYNFGNIQNSALEFPYDSEGNPILYVSREENRSDLSGLNFNLGLHYQTMLSSKLELQAATTFSPKSNIISKNERTIATVVVDNFSGNESVVNDIDVDLAANGLAETELILPSKFTNALFADQGTSFEDASTLSIGGFYIPQYNSLSSFWKRATYRAGLRFENTGLNINNQSIEEFGISFGVGLPVGNGFSNANLGFGLENVNMTNSIKF